MTDVLLVGYPDKHHPMPGDGFRECRIESSEILLPPQIAHQMSPLQPKVNPTDCDILFPASSVKEADRVRAVFHLLRPYLQIALL